MSALFDTFFVVLQCADSVTFRQADITHRTIDLVELVLVFVALGHLLQITDSTGAITFQLRQTNTRIEIHLPIRLHIDNLFIIRARFVTVTIQFIQLRQYIGKTRTIALTLLLLHGDFYVRNSLFVQFGLELQVCRHSRIQCSILSLQVVHLNLTEQVIGFVQPTRLGISSHRPKLALRHNILVVVKVFLDVVERADTLQEITFVELRLTQQQPGFRHGRIKLFLLQPRAIRRVVCLLRVSFRTLLDAVQFDALTALLDSAVHLALGRLGSLVIADRIEVQQRGVVVMVRLGDVLQALLKRSVAVVVDVVVHLHGVVRTTGLRILLRGTRGHQ